MFTSLNNTFKVARAGLAYNDQAFAGPIVRNSWEKIYQNTMESMSKDLLFEWFK